jgi:hypothetical protein
VSGHAAFFSRDSTVQSDGFADGGKNLQQGPPEKPRLCNACGAHYLVKHTLHAYFPGRRASGSGSASPSADSSSRHRTSGSPAAKRVARSTTPAQHNQKQQQHRHQQQQQQQQHLQQQDTGAAPSPACSVLSSFADTSADVSTSQSIKQSQELVEVEQPAVVGGHRGGSQLPALAAHDGGSSRKRSRLGAGCVCEVRAGWWPQCHPHHRRLLTLADLLHCLCRLTRGVRHVASARSRRPAAA